MWVYFYKYAGDDRLADKAKVIGNGFPVNATITGACSVTEPTFILDYDDSILKMNYMYVPEFARYYKLSPPTIDEGKRMYVHGTVDSVASWIREIKNSQCTVIRSEKYGIGDVVDSMLPIKPSSTSVKVTDIPNASISLSPSSGRNYIVTLK